MLEFSNETGWAAGLFPGWDEQLMPQMTAVFKASYSFDEQGQLSPLEDESLVMTDEHRGNPATSGLVAVNEIMPYKQGSEVYVYATAIPEQDHLLAMEVGLGILFTDKTQWKKVLRIFGERRWKKTLVNYIHDDNPQPVQSIPIDYEYAFGGAHPEDVDDVFAANPIGIGYNSDQRHLLSNELPRIEQGPEFMANPMQKPTPAGFAPLPVFWEPRVSDCGPLAEDPVAQAGCPYTRAAKRCLHNVAPLDQRFARPFKGGEIIHLRALVPGVDHKKSVQVILPELHPQLYLIVDNEAQNLSPVCDTLVINTDAKSLSMVFRVGIPWRMTDRRQGWVVLKDLDTAELPYDKEGRDVPGMASN